LEPTLGSFCLGQTSERKTFNEVTQKMDSLGAEVQISAALQRTGLPANLLAELSRHAGHHVSSAKLSGALNGGRPLSNGDALFLKNLLRDLDDAILACYPIPLSMRNPKALYDLIQSFKNNPPDSPTLADLILLSTILSGRDLKEIADGRKITMEQLRERIAEISIKGRRTFTHALDIVEAECK
jgi:hypothetical protein